LVGLISTGDEIVAADRIDIQRGQVRDSNKIMFKSLLAGMGVP
jgi:molybdopterin biosynthesis enzyme